MQRASNRMRMRYGSAMVLDAPASRRPPFELRLARELETLVRRRARTPLGISSVEPFGDGHSGFTYRLEMRMEEDVQSCVLRLSPPGARIAGPADIGRQGRIMAALAAAGVPVPRVIACDSHRTLAGRSWALMQHVDGQPAVRAAASYGHHAVARAAIEALQGFQAVPRSRCGIGQERAMLPQAEVARWQALLERVDLALRREGIALAERLISTAPPPSSRPVLSHGDFHYGNLLFEGPRVKAVVDWEIATVGEPLFDLGCLAVSALRRKYDPEPNPTGGVPVDLEQLADLYDAPLDSLAWHTSAVCFKYAAILGYNGMLHRSGKRPDPIYEQLRRTTAGLMRDGRAILDSGGAIATVLREVVGDVD